MIKGVIASLSAVIVAMVSFFFYARKKNKEVERANNERIEAENVAYEAKMEAEASKQKTAELEIESEMLKAVANLGKDIHKAVLKKKEQTAKDEKDISAIKEKTPLAEEEKRVAEELSKDPFESCD